MAAPHYRRVHLKLEGWFLNPEVERVQGVDRAAGVGECGFPGCMLPDKHAGLHQVGELQPRVRNAVRPKKELECGTPSAKKARRACLLYTSPSPRDQRGSRMPSSA